MSVLDNITKRVTDTAKAAAKKSGGVVEVTKLNMSIGSDEEKVRKLYSEMGKIVYDEYGEGEEISDTLKEYCEKIDLIHNNIEEMKQKILELRNVKACPGCGIELEIDMTFCHKCGRKQEIPAVAEQSSGESL
jgi:hypothetical protein